MLGGFHSWQDPLCWSGPSHTHSVAGGWKKAWEAIKCSLLRGNVSSIALVSMQVHIAGQIKFQQHVEHSTASTAIVTSILLVTTGISLQLREQYNSNGPAGSS